MGTPTEALEAKLAQFEQLRPGEGARLRAMITGSPELNAMLEEAVALGNLEGGFEPLDRADPINDSTGGRYYQDREVMAVANDLLLSNLAEDTNTVLMTLGHETAHAIDAASITENHDLFFSDLDTAAAGRPPRDYTTAVQGFLERSRTLEAHAELAGVNVLAADVKRDNPGATQEQLYRLLFESTHEASRYFDVSTTNGHTTYTPKPGLVFNDQFQLETNAAHTAAFGEHFFDAGPYRLQLGTAAVNTAGTRENVAFQAELAKAAANELDYPLALATVDLAALGIDPKDIWMPSGIGNAPRPVAPEHAAPATAPATPGRPDGAALSPESEAVLRDSERFVRQLASQHQLTWDAGLDNTVFAVARSAREAGMTAITHFRLVDGTLRFAQDDGFGLKEARLDAKVGANMPAAESLERMETLDRAAPPRPAPQPERQIEESLFR